MIATIINNIRNGILIMFLLIIWATWLIISDSWNSNKKKSSYDPEIGDFNVDSDCDYDCDCDGGGCDFD